MDGTIQREREREREKERIYKNVNKNISLGFCQQFVRKVKCDFVQNDDRNIL